MPGSQTSRGWGGFLFPQGGDFEDRGEGPAEAATCEVSVGLRILSPGAERHHFRVADALSVAIDHVGFERNFRGRVGEVEEVIAGDLGAVDIAADFLD